MAEKRSPDPRYGVYRAIVIDNVDPLDQGRVLVEPSNPPDPDNPPLRMWAIPCVPYAGPDQGFWFIPEIDDEVLLAFENGDPRNPIVLGALWNGRDAPPETMDSANSIKSITSRGGVKITLDDTGGQERLSLETPGGQQFTLKDGPGEIEILDSYGSSVKLEAGGITIASPSKVTISASQIEVTAGMLTVNAGISQFSGVVKADSVITNSVISSTYSPGAGNIW